MYSKKLFVLLILFVGAISISGCSDECSSYSKYSCKEIQKATYNTYFYYPNGNGEYLGVAIGLSQCGALAHNFSASKNLSRNNDWSYICCMKAEGSECLEKHR